MDNPWLRLRFNVDTYFLKEDEECLESHNRDAHERTRFALGSIPEPFIGNPKTATVVLLGKNPGHASGAEREYRENPDLCAAMFSNLRHELTDCPFYPLNPVFANTGAGVWWQKRTREIQNKLGRNLLSRMAEKLMVIESFPYHSINFSRPKGNCSSQDYSSLLVKRMLDEGKLVVGMRAERFWKGVDKRIASIPFLKNPQCGYISSGNTTGDTFERILEALSQ
jgi:hypothetical protein